MGKVIQFKQKENKNIYIILAILIVVTLALVYINIVHGAYTKPLNLNNNTIMTIEDSGYIFKKYGNDIVACGHEGLTAISKNGEIKWKVPFTTATPFMITNDKYIFCADLGGNQYSVFSSGRPLVTEKTPYEIITANINESGHYAVATKERGYKAQITVFDIEGRQIFAWHSTKYHVLSLAVANNNKSMLVSVLDSDNTGGDAFKLLHFSFSKETPTEIESGENNLISSITVSGNKFYAVGDTALYAYNENGKKSFIIDYSGRTIQRYSITDSEVLLALTKTSVEGYYGGSVVEIYTPSGSMRGSFEVDDEITFLDTEQNKILVNSPDGAYILSGNGRLYGNLTFSNEVREGLIFSGGKKLLLINGSNVNIYDSK